MNKEKLNKYRLTGSIHTLSIRVDGAVGVIPKEYSDAVKCSSRKTEQGTVTTCILNLNKIEGEIYSFWEFLLMLQTVLNSMGIMKYRIIRADMRFDSFELEHYQEFSKLNRYLISMLAVTYHVRNTYFTQDLFSQKQLSVAVKNKYFEIENYDKEAESNGTDAACSRLEERSKSWKNNDFINEFVGHWFRRWDKAIEKRAWVHKRYNDELERIYKEGKNSFPVQFRSLTDFLIQYRGCIFCKEQMVELLSRFDEVGAEKAEIRAKNHKSRNGIEYFSENDIMYAVNEIKRATKEFFEN